MCSVWCKDILCWFSLLTCCGCRDFVTRKLVYFPPDKPYYNILNSNDNNNDTSIELKTNNNDNNKDKLIFKTKDDKPSLKSFLMKQFGVRLSNFTTQYLKTYKNEIIPSYYIKNNKNEYTILFSHGNAADIGLMRNHLLDMHCECNVNIFAYEYTGYGLSTGKASIKNSYADIEAAYNYLVNKLGILPHKIIPYGQSLGTAVSVHLGCNYPVAGIILHSPLMSGLRVLQHFDKTYWFDIYPVVEQIQQIFAPIWVIHGMRDQEIDVIHGKILSRLAPNSYQPWFVELAGHNDIEILYRKELFDKLKKFISMLKRKERNYILNNNVNINNINNNNNINDIKEEEELTKNIKKLKKGNNNNIVSQYQNKSGTVSPPPPVQSFKQFGPNNSHNRDHSGNIVTTPSIQPSVGIDGYRDISIAKSFSAFKTNDKPVSERDNNKLPAVSSMDNIVSTTMNIDIHDELSDETNTIIDGSKHYDNRNNNNNNNNNININDGNIKYAIENDVLPISKNMKTNIDHLKKIRNKNLKKEMALNNTGNRYVNEITQSNDSDDTQSTSNEDTDSQITINDDDDDNIDRIPVGSNSNLVRSSVNDVDINISNNNDNNDDNKNTSPRAVIERVSE